MNFHKSHTFFSPPPATVFSGCGMQSKPSEAKQARVCLRVAVFGEKFAVVPIGEAVWGVPDHC